MRAIDVNGRHKYITWITFRFLDNLTSINYGDKFEKFFCKIGLPELELEKENETSLEDFFYTPESPSNPMTFISNYLLNVIASIVEKNYWSFVAEILNTTKDVLIDRIEHEYSFYCSNLIDNNCFLIFNPHKYHLWFNIDYAI